MPPRLASLSAYARVVPPMKPLTSRFDEGYGDFVMRSSDNVLLYFPKFLLGHASPFFKDLFSISEHAGDSSSVDNSQPLAMEEDLATLEDLLLCIDPSKSMPPIKPNTIAKVLRAAHKYQIEKFIAYFAYVVGQESTCDCTAAQNRTSFLSTDPTLVLVFAEQYNLPDLARLALRQLIVEPMDKLISSNPAISVKTWLHLLALRKQRTDWFLGYIDRITKSRHQNQDCVCAKCHSSLMAWTRKVHDTPSWCSIEDCIPTMTETCRYPNQGPPGYPYYSISTVPVSPDLKVWEKEAKELERQLPALPNGVFGV